jgi:hypothetical protein
MTTTDSTTTPARAPGTVAALVVCPHSGAHRACVECRHRQPHRPILGRNEWQSRCDSRCRSHRKTFQCVTHNKSSTFGA